MSVDDLAREARRRVPRGGLGLRRRRRRRRARDAPQPRGVRPGRAATHTFAPVGEPDTSTTILGRPAAAPIVLAPTGYTRLSPPLRRVRGRRGSAQAHGLPYTLSTYATTSIPTSAAAAPDGRNWFQLYLMKDRDVSLAHLAAGPPARVRGGGADRRHDGHGREVAGQRNGFAIPPALTARTVAGMARRPGWVGDILTTEPLRFATFPRGLALRPLGDVQRAARAGAATGRRRLAQASSGRVRSW